MSNLFNEITNIDNLYKSYNQALKAKNKYSAEAIEFSMNETYNIYKLQRDLITGDYQFEGYIRFKVYEPKERIIDAPHFKDKIVQLAINNVLKNIYLQTFIYDSYACLENKGTHKAVDRVQRFLRKSSWEYGQNTFIVKFDISKFFYSIDREILKRLLTKKIKCKKTVALLYNIIDSASIIDKVGIPLGNTTSQLFANIYLNELDQYCKRKLHIKYYVRYMDDVVAIVKNKENAKEIMKLMIDFAETNLNLRVSEKKTKVFPIAQGVNAFGFKIYKTHRLLRNDSKKKIKRKTKKMKHLIKENKMEIYTAEQILNSWFGHAKHANSYNFINKLIDKNKHIYLDNKGSLRVNLKEVFKGDCI